MKVWVGAVGCGASCGWGFAYSGGGLGSGVFPSGLGWYCITRRLCTDVFCVSWEEEMCREERAWVYLVRF